MNKYHLNIARNEVCIEAIWYENLSWQNRIIYKGFLILTESNSQQYFGKLYKLFVVNCKTTRKEHVILAIDVLKDLNILAGTKLIEFVEENIQQMYFVTTPTINSCAKIVELLHSYENKINLWI